MAEPQRNILGPYIPQGNVFSETLQQVKLAWNLMLDKRVPLPTKFIPVAALVYLVSPPDLIPDIFLGLGQLDDLAMLMLGLRVFFELAPDAVMREHLQRLAQSMAWRQNPKSPAAEDIIEGDVVERKD